ncbi:rhodanese-like domain-containing protein [Niveibacterium sp. 24ML]|uniref:rhodanese-like domain-containing protein n=1 Tax=Niveibacterium sp. 24ML TaxID=2985512 RepID=UPI00226E85EE|nr:rhodanese-like domain-containing protein [Niveibacterium sp. 24ML]MCX9156794.1 rhodanese-like domain-containing protein [Niveibacterium sp. 24ML]
MEFIKQNVFLVVITVVSGAMLIAELLRGRSGAGGLTPVEATLLINRENAIVLDVRDASEFATGHLPNARNIPLIDLEKRASELSKFKSKPIIVVCQTGARSNRALATLKAAGLEKAYNLTGGLALWRKDNLPVVKS